MFTEMFQEVKKCVCLSSIQKNLPPPPPFAARWPVDQEMIAEVDMGDNKVWRCTIPCG